MPIETIKQRTVTLQMEGGSAITVRRLRWKAAKAFLRMLADTLGQLYKGGGLSLAEPGSAPAAFADRIPELIAQSEELTQFLIQNSTDLNAEQIDALDALAASEVLRAALEVNLDEELKKCWAGIAAVVAGLMPGSKRSTTTSPSVPSTPTSSMPATPPTT